MNTLIKSPTCSLGVRQHLPRTCFSLPAISIFSKRLHIWALKSFPAQPTASSDGSVTRFMTLFFFCFFFSLLSSHSPASLSALTPDELALFYLMLLGCEVIDFYIFFNHQNKNRFFSHSRNALKDQCMCFELAPS